LLEPVHLREYAEALEVLAILVRQTLGEIEQTAFVSVSMSARFGGPSPFWTTIRVLKPEGRLGKFQWQIVRLDPRTAAGEQKSNSTCFVFSMIARAVPELMLLVFMVRIIIGRASKFKNAVSQLAWYLREK
jgi:hypothetical protein